MFYSKQYCDFAKKEVEKYKNSGLGGHESSLTLTYLKIGIVPILLEQEFTQFVY